MTNTALIGRTGTECYIRDVATGLLQRGHEPVVYSSSIGAQANELQATGISVVDDLSKVGEAPDLIHAQHHLEAMAALLYFPNVPAVYVCHGSRPWEELPPKFPRIKKYIAVDEATYDRLAIENCIPAERITTLLNFVDLARIQVRASLPDRPKRALIFSNYVTAVSPYYHAVESACSALGLELEVLGAGMGRSVPNPGELLSQFDVVFAQGRSALEAMAAGSAVMVCSSRAFGPLITNSNFEDLRRKNFGIRTLCHPVSSAVVIEELSRYSGIDAQAVAQKTRELCSLEQALDQLLEIYDEVIGEQVTSPSNVEEESKAASRYLKTVSLGYKEIAALNDQYRAVEKSQRDLNNAERVELKVKEDCSEFTPGQAAQILGPQARAQPAPVVDALIQQFRSWLMYVGNSLP